MVVRDEALRLLSNLQHHRALGVDRFLVVDNGSTDGTLDLLRAQPDVHIFHAPSPFAASMSGLRWTNWLRDQFCDGYWTLNVDADELFIFPGYDRIGLHPLCRFLDGVGADAVLALMLDMYAAADISEAVHTPGGSLVETCPWFDPGPYPLVRSPRFPNVRIYGGVRARVFDFAGQGANPPMLNKAPLVRWRRGMRYVLSTHELSRGQQYPILAALLHFKFLSDFPERVRMALDDGRYVAAGPEYRAYHERVAREGGLVLRNDQSVRFIGADQLKRLHILQSTAEFDAFVEREAAAQAR